MPKVPISVISLFIAPDSDIPSNRLPVSMALAAKFPIIPLRLMTNQGDRIIIDRISNICREASTKAGGLGDKYTCIATLANRQRVIYVFRDDVHWFLEDNF